MRLPSRIRASLLLRARDDHAPMRQRASGLVARSFDESVRGACDWGRLGSWDGRASIEYGRGWR